MSDAYSKRSLPQLLNHLRSYRRFYILVVAISINIFMVFSSYPFEHIKRFSYFTFTLYGALFIFSFPLRLVPGALLFGGLFTYLLWWTNEEKSSLTQLPLTYLDFKITLSNPEGVINAVKAPEWSIYALAVLAAGIMCLVLWYCVKSVLTAVRRGPWTFTVNALLLVFFLVSANVFLKQYNSIVKTHILKSDMAWESIKFTELSRVLGIWGFLSYSYYLEQTEMGDFYKSESSAPPPEGKEIIEAVRKYVNIDDKNKRVKPNIVVVLAESTFDPSDFFKLTNPVHNKLFEPNKGTQAIGHLYVNAVGGGTWITEFEFLTGLDSRIFGYSGFYTHSSLSPYIEESFVTYLTEHGYVTEAYYAIERDFYNAENAYNSYGFDNFFADIGLEGWYSTDEQVINSVIEQSRTQDAPFMKFIITTENHSPHICKHFSNREQLATTFEGLYDFNDANCVLNEFIRNMQSTERAYLKLIEYLEDQEKLTGRPFVLLIYGDHQPHTFSKFSLSIDYEGSSKYRQFRKDLNERITFFHIVSSIPGVLSCCNEAPPHITMMPTLLSAYVASGYDDLYLGVNIYSYDKCGSDFMGNTISSGGYGADSAFANEAEKCPVYENLLTAYRNSGIVSNMR